jgi:hypothetical protein
MSRCGLAGVAVVLDPPGGLAGWADFGVCAAGGFCESLWRILAINTAFSGDVTDTPSEGTVTAKVSRNHVSTVCVYVHVCLYIVRLLNKEKTHINDNRRV